MPVVPLVLVAAALHASWNAMVKSAHDRLAAMALVGGAAVLTAIPLALAASFPRSGAVPFFVASALVHGAYNLLLVGCYRDGDFNAVYPVARGIAPPTVAICAAVLVGERLSAAQTAGVCVVTLGMAAIAFGQGGASRRGLGFAAVTGLSIAAYTVLDGIGVRRSGTALGYTAWLFLGQGLIVPAVWWALRGRGRALRLAAVREAAPALARGVLAGVLSVIAYGLVLWAQTRGALAVVAALRETSVVFGAAIGAALFRERMPTRRVAAATLIAAGALLLAAG